MTMHPEPDPKQARTIAVEAHGAQLYGNQPYSVHLDAVASLLNGYGPFAQSLGYLHDVFEDTAVDRLMVAEIFGNRMVRCIDLMTDVAGATRAQRKATSNQKLKAIHQNDEIIVLVVKAADRLANVRVSLIEGSVRKLAMYGLEHTAFREAAFRPGLADELWAELDSVLHLRVDTTMNGCRARS